MSQPAASPLRLFWLQTGAQIGGTEMMNFRTWGNLDKNQFHVELCFLDEAGPVSELYRHCGGNPIHLNYHQRPLRHVFQELKARLTGQPYDIAHIFGTRANLLGRWLARRRPSLKVVSGQRSVGSGHPSAAWIERATAPWVDYYIANSFAGAEWLAARAHIPRPKITTIHSGLDVTPFATAAPGQIRPGLGIGPEEMVLISVGNMRKVKDQETLLKAVRELQGEGYPLHLLIVGDGQRRQVLEKLANDLQLAEVVHFLGRRSDVSAVLADSDIKVLSSRSEGLPAALMEAMAAALPVVATAVGGVPELVLPEQTGFLVPPQDPQALAAALKMLIEDPVLRRQFGRAGQARIQRHFPLREKVMELENTYRQLVSNV